MLDNLTISSESRAQCKIHGKDLEFVRTKIGVFEKDLPLAICPECQVDEKSKNQAAFKVYANYGACSISMLNFPPHRVSEAPNDYSDSEIEYFLVNKNSSSGYSNGSLVYIPERNLLAVCESNGKIAFWSIGDQITLENTIAVGETIKFAKYFNISETERYFIVCSNRGFHIYKIVKNLLMKREILESDPLIIDLECIPEEEKLLSVGFEGNIGIWDLQTMKIVEVLDMSKYNIDTRIHRIIYMKESKKLALEHEKGLSVFDYNQYKKGIQENLIQHYLVENKEAYGCVYLPQNKRFLLKNNFKESVLINEEGLVKIEDVKGCSTFNKNRGDNNNHTRFIANENESIVIGSHSAQNYSLYGNSLERFGGISKFVQEGGDVEVMHNQHRFAIADKTQGLVIILRANCGKSMFKNLYMPGLLRIQEVKNAISSAAIPFIYKAQPPPPSQVLSSAIIPNGSLFGNSAFSTARPAVKVMGTNSPKDPSSTLIPSGSLFGNSALTTALPAAKVMGTNPPKDPSSTVIPSGSLFGNSTLTTARPTVKVVGRNSQKDPSSTEKAEKLGKKIKKVQVKPKSKKSKAEVKKKVKTTVKTVKAKKTKKSTSKTTEKKVTKKPGKEIIEMVRLKKMKGKSKKEKEEKVWVVLEEEKGEKKERGRTRVRKNSNKNKKEQKRSRKNESVSQERSRSRSDSKSLTRKGK